MKNLQSVYSSTLWCLKMMIVLSVPQLTKAIETTVTSLGNGNYQVAYDLNLYGITSGNDVVDVFAAAIDSNGTIALSTSGPSFWNGAGVTSMTHTFDVEPARMVLMGVTVGVPGGLNGTDKDHIILAASHEFAAAARGYQWSESFPGPANAQGERMRHSQFVPLLQHYSDNLTNTTLEAQLVTFLEMELMSKAGFQKEFRVVRFSLATITGIVFEDKNRNGQANEGEALAGVTLTITASNPVGCATGSVVSDENGEYTLTVIGPCQFEVELSGFENNCEPIGMNPVQINAASSTTVNIDIGFECIECGDGRVEGPDEDCEATEDCVDYYKCKGCRCVCTSPVPFKWLFCN